MSGYPQRAREIVETMKSLGYSFSGTTGKGHLRFTKEGVRGFIVTPATPYSKRAVDNCRMLVRRHERRNAR